jgi:glutathione S-transferase
MEIVIGDRTYSSWSLRPWLVLKRSGLAFSERLVTLRGPNPHADILAAGSPSGLVPVLKDGDLTLWDSLAISEYLAERAPAAGLWPAEPRARALARAAASEMHSGFASLRGECLMNLAVQEHRAVSPATEKDVRRIVALWSDLLAGSGGPFLLGAWSIADAFYTPVATRFRTYGVRLSDFGDQGAAAPYAERLLATPEFLEWERAALADVR